MWAAEDEAAQKMTCADALASFHAISDNIKSMVKTGSYDDKELMVHLMLLKQLNRQAHFRNKLVRDEVTGAKKEVGEKHLKLQNLLYEVLHLQKEVKKCLEFRSGDEAIDLISVEEFKQTAPEEMRKEGQSPHDFQLNRLKFELEQRKELSKDHSEKLLEVKQLEDEISTLEESLNGLGPKLDTIIQATIPVQKLLGRDYLQEYEQQMLAALLPQPLYSLYAQLSACAVVEKDCGLTVTIHGDEKSVTAYQQSQGISLAAASASVTPEPMEMEQGLIPDENSQEPKLENSQDSQGPEKGKHGTTKDDITKYESFPLEIEVQFKQNGSEFTLYFWFYPFCNLILCSADLNVTQGSVKTIREITDGNSFICDFFDGDNGLSCPPATEALLQKSGKSFDSFRQGKLCFQWVNRLCGFGVVPGVKVLNYANTHNLVTRINAALKERVSFVQELANLETQQVDLTEIPYAIPKFGSVFSEEAARILGQPLNTEKHDFWPFTVEMLKGKATDSLLILVPHTYPRLQPVLYCISKNRNTDFKERFSAKLNLGTGTTANDAVLTEMLKSAARFLAAEDGKSRRCGRDRKVF